ncbi:MAG: STAS domain-containing protein [bacterium]|jgi:anti-sigma B factor antagonist|nr:STAS domain-containing protein [bacterium]
MDINVEKVGQITVVEMTGQLDSTNASNVQQHILSLAEQNSKILLDLSNVTYMSSAGLRILLLLYRRIRDNIGNVVIAGLSEEVRDVMAITGFLDCFTTFDSRNAGLRALAA